MSVEKVAIVTGGYGAIGTEIARGLAEHDFRVVIVGRDGDAARRTAESLRADTGNDRVGFDVVDLSLSSEIESFAARWEGRLDVLVNNVGATPRRRTETAEGLEVQFATNVMSYVRMTLAFEDVLRRSAPSRVVNVASYWAGDLDVDDLQFERRRYDNDTAYRQSKQANRMLTVALAERFADANVTVNACHPGDTPSKLARNLGFGGNQTPQQCAVTPLYLAVDGNVAGVSGRWFSNRSEARDPFVSDPSEIERLWDAVQPYVGM